MHCRALPEGLRFAHLSRLAKLTLRGYVSHKRLWEERKPQVKSLTTLSIMQHGM